MKRTRGYVSKEEGKVRQQDQDVRRKVRKSEHPENVLPRNGRSVEEKFPPLRWRKPEKALQSFAEENSKRSHMTCLS